MVKSDKFLKEQMLNLREDLIEAIKNKVPDNKSVFFAELVGNVELDKLDRIKGIQHKDGHYFILENEADTYPAKRILDGEDNHDILFDILEKLNDENNEIEPVY